MKNTTYPFLILVLIFLILYGACTRIQNDEKSFSYDSFQYENHLSNGKIYENEKLLIGQPLWMKLHPDSFLIIQDYGTPKLIKIIDLKNNHIQEIISEGRGPGEMLIGWGIELLGKNVYTFCPMLKKVIVLTLGVDRNFFISQEKTIDSDIRPMELCPLTENLFACLNVNDETRLTLIDSVGKVIGKIGDYPSFRSRYDIKPDNDIFQSSIASSPSGDKIVLACKRTDIIEIISLKKDKHIRLHGPLGINLEVIDHGIAKSPEPSYNTYYVLSVNEKEIWISYSGYKNTKSTSLNPSDYLPKQILCFNWQGQPLRKIQLDYPFGGFDIDWKNRLLYTLELRDNYAQIVRYQLDQFNK